MTINKIGNALLGPVALTVGILRCQTLSCSLILTVCYAQATLTFTEITARENCPQ
ncbi:hypothetical protein RNAN_0489 [Rheinheimera nanhaiensis E407-8]|uniref:Uncharacterized protein n=1 Tax=Rheinheimera nanhaiensis E407-8 TaxID=562729 RepID=I1DTZ3_9GAMM|nr:hypothetical protein RNAN_0489 [Rheinheimera nanhaiensis E407-8]